jgi:hypothetical protein
MSLQELRAQQTSLQSTISAAQAQLRLLRDQTLSVLSETFEFRQDFFVSQRTWCDMEFSDETETFVHWSNDDEIEVTVFSHVAF